VVPQIPAGPTADALAPVFAGTGLQLVAVDDFTTNLRSTLEGIDEHFEGVDAPDLDMALDDASACQG